MEVEGNNVFGEVVDMNAPKSTLSNSAYYLMTRDVVVRQCMAGKWSSQVAKKS